MKNNFENYTLEEISEFLSKTEKEILSKEVESRLIENNLKELLKEKEELISDIKNECGIEVENLDEFIATKKTELVELLNLIQEDLEKMNAE